MNKALVDLLITQYEARGMDAFIFEWNGTRTPEKVTFPDGQEKIVGYMRDGMLLFKDKSSAVYERLADIYPQQPQSVLIGYTPSMHQKGDAK